MISSVSVMLSLLRNWLAVLKYRQEFKSKFTTKYKDFKDMELCKTIVEETLGQGHRNKMPSP